MQTAYNTKPMIDKLLSAKHWQLFLLTFGIPIIFQFIMIGSMFSNIANGAEPEPDMMVNYMKYYPVLMIVFIGVWFGWLWAVAIGLQAKIPDDVTMKVKKFKIFFFIPLVYLFFISVFIGSTMSGLIENGTAPSNGMISGLIGIILPLHLFSMFCIFYSLYFVAKTFKTAELQRETAFSDFAGEFFLIWFYPIGVWIIQPKVNKMVEE